MNPAVWSFWVAVSQGVHAAMELERTLGDYTNVEVTIVHWENNFLFHPLLPAVVGGSVLPSNVVHPIRRMCPRTEFVRGHVSAIDALSNEVTLDLPSGQMGMLQYDQLIVALDAEPDYTMVPGLLEHALPFKSIGDALHVRRRIIDNLEQATTTADPDLRNSLLTVCVLGGGIKGCAIAAELRTLFRSALASYSSLEDNELRIVLIDNEGELLAGYPSNMAAAVEKRLLELGVELRLGYVAATVEPDAVVMASGVEVPAGMVVNTLSTFSPVLKGLTDRDSQIVANSYLQLKSANNIFVAGDDPREAVFWARREIDMGRHAALNASAALRGEALRKWSEPHHVFDLLPLGRTASVFWIFGIVANGFVAGSLFKLQCLLAMPTLERNLRLILDWIIGSMFHQNIAVLTAGRSLNRNELHVEASKEIIRAG
ncbi:MAG: NAD(P)/FAD-dependent oxidoreductase, partial [Gammaproteobacteria bacterium]